MQIPWYAKSEEIFVRNNVHGVQHKASYALSHGEKANEYTGSKGPTHPK